MNPKNNSLKLDFLEYKTILRYILVIGIVLLGGVVLKNGVAILFALLILYLSATKNIYRAVESFFIYNFFIGQGYISSEIIVTYIANPSFMLFVVFIFFISSIPKQIFNAKFIITWFIFTDVSQLKKKLIIRE